MEVTVKADKARKSIRSKDSSIKSKVSNKGVSKKQSTVISKESQSEISLTEEEEKALIVSSVWQEIVATAFDQIYENDLDKETVYFVSRCSRSAWRALVDWNYQIRDPGGYATASEEGVDSEPHPSAKDSWAGRSVPVGGGGTAEGAQPRASTAASDPCTLEASSSAADTKTTVTSETKTPTDVANELLRIMGKRPRARSDLETVLGARIGTTIKSVFELKKDSYEMPSPVAMQPKYFPPARVEVEYAVGAGTRGVLSKKQPKTKTVHLKCVLPGEAEEAERAGRRSRVSQKRALTGGTFQM